jgi:hypothetical protein
MDSLARLHPLASLLSPDFDILVAAAAATTWQWNAALAQGKVAAAAATTRQWNAALAQNGMINRCSVDLPCNRE